MSQSQQPPPEPLFLLHNSKPINTIIFSKFNDNILYTGNRDGFFDEYNLSIRRSIFTANPNSNAILSILELDMNKILVHCRDGSLFEFNRNDLQWSFNCIFTNENYTFCKIDVSVDKSNLFLPSKDTSCIDRLNLKTYQITHQIRPLKSTSYGMLMGIKVIDSIRLLAAYENGDICLFDLDTCTQLDCKTFFYGQPILSFDYSTILNIGYVTCNENIIKQFFINEIKIIESNSTQIKNPGINVLKIRPSDSKIFATGGWDSRLRIYSTKKAKLLCVLDFHKNAVNSIDFSLQNNILAVSSNDGLISIWKIY